MKLILDTLKRAGVDGVVMDLRQNGGGSLMEAVELTGLFIKQGPVVQVRDPRGKVEVDQDDDPSISWSGPLAVLVDRFSASASEIFSGAIQDYGRGLIIGTQTYGKGTVQNAIDLDKIINPAVKSLLAGLIKKGTGQVSKSGTGSQSTFGQLNLTIAKFYRISGSSTQHKGVTPDIKFPSVIPMDKYGEDTEPSALPFDMINKSDYTKAGDFTTVLPQLNKLHEQRMNTNANYKYLLQDIEDYKKRDAEKSITLNEAALKQQRDADDQKTFERNNLKRVALGLPPLKKGEKENDLAASKKGEKVQGKKLIGRAGAKSNNDLDFLKIEAGQILTDYISLDNKMTSVAHP